MCSVYVDIFDTCSSLLHPGPAGCNGSSLSNGWPSQKSLDPSVQQLWHSHHKTNPECKGCCYPNMELCHQPLFQMWFSVGKSLCLGIWIWPWSRQDCASGSLSDNRDKVQVCLPLKGEESRVNNQNWAGACGFSLSKIILTCNGINLLFPSHVCSAHDGNCWGIFLPLFLPKTFSITFSSSGLLRRGSEKVSGWAAGHAQPTTAVLCYSITEISG